jgi:thiol-disulfide isomerase/thioredoxin
MAIYPLSELATLRAEAHAGRRSMMHTLRLLGGFLSLIALAPAGAQPVPVAEPETKPAAGATAPLASAERRSLPPELAAALREAMADAKTGRPDQKRTVTLDAAQSAAVMKHFGAMATEGQAVRRNKPFPRISLPTLAGESLPLTGFTTVVNFWATWCAPCIAEMPLFEALAAEGEDRVVTINNDFDRADLDAWLRVNPLGLPVHYDDGNALAGELGINQWPTTLVLDPNGVVVADFSTGVTDLASLKARLAER